MERNVFINGRNIWSTWGAELMDGALEAILTPPPVKDYIEMTAGWNMAYRLLHRLRSVRWILGSSACLFYYGKLAK